MEPGQLLFAILSQAPAVVALLGTRFYPILAPQPTPFPYATYQVITLGPAEGSSEACPLDDEARVQLSFFAKTYTEVCALAAACRAALATPEARARLAGVGLAFDGHRDQASDPTFCFFRTSDYLLDGLAT